MTRSYFWVRFRVNRPVRRFDSDVECAERRRRTRKRLWCRMCWSFRGILLVMRIVGVRLWFLYCLMARYVDPLRRMNHHLTWLQTVAIIDIDCTEPAGFDDVDKKYLEQLAQLLAESCDW